MSDLGVLLAFDGLMYGLPVVIVALYVWRRQHWRRLAREADQAEHAGKTRGGQSVVHGVVEVEDGKPAITLEIDEDEWPQQGGAVVWKEKARRVTARPFVVRTAGGEAIRVVPDERVLVIRDLETIAMGNSDRTRRATVGAGDKIHAVGELEAARTGSDPYRDGGAPAELRAPRRGRLTISSWSLKSRFEQHARYLSSKATGAAWFAVAIHCLWGLAWHVDIRQLHLLLRAVGLDAAGAWLESSTVVTVIRYALLLLATLGALGDFFVDRPWYEGKVTESEALADVQAARRAFAKRSDPPREP